MVEGFKMRDDGVWKKIAQMTSWVTAPHLKNPINPKKLLNGEESGKVKKSTTPQETANVINELVDDIKVV